jgi:uroporphyrin-III C-methyltransferase
MSGRAEPGTVYLVGAGPGDPGLLTCRGRDLLAAADVVVHDRLIDRRVLALCRPDAEVVDAGKAPGSVRLTQAAICELLIERARAGRAVVRLKGGDPFVFGRGGEEATACARAHVPCEVVPGVTSAVAAPSLAGIPLTHRGVASSFAVVTAHAPRRDWTGFAAADTLVVLMGAARVAETAGELMAAGRSPDTPAAVIASASLPSQRVARSTLAGIAEAAATAGCANPAVLVIGAVVALAAGRTGTRGPMA